MPATSAHGIQIVQPDAWLADSQWIGWRRNLTRGHERLEISDRCNGEINVVTPSGNHRISGYARVASGLEVAQIVLPHLVKAVLALEHGSANECVRIAWRVATGLSGRIPGPEELVAAWAFPTFEPSVCEEIQSILIFGEHLDQRDWKDATTLKAFLRNSHSECQAGLFCSRGLAVYESKPS